MDILDEHTTNDQFLLTEFRKLWKHRLLAIGEHSDHEILTEAIKRELLDENSHPRIRKNRYEKYYLSIRKIVAASIESEAKLLLIQRYNEQMEELSEEKK